MIDYSKAWIPLDKGNPEAGDLVYVTDMFPREDTIKTLIDGF